MSIDKQKLIAQLQMDIDFANGWSSEGLPSDALHAGMLRQAERILQMLLGGSFDEEDGE